MIAEWNPGLVLILGALAIPFLKGGARTLYMAALPVIAGAQLAALSEGNHGVFQAFGYELILTRVDGLSTIFGAIFILASFLNVIYAAHEDDGLQASCAMSYAGAGVAAVFAGDLITLFAFWELTALTSVFLVWNRKSEGAYQLNERDKTRSFDSGMRYLIIHIGSGVLLVTGIVMHAHATGSIAFDQLAGRSMDWSESYPFTAGTFLIFVAFGIKCAFPLLHNWLQDSYPESSVVGAVVLSAFTTKLAVYALARGFPGVEALIWIGAIMTAFPVFFAVIENDLRRVLAFSLNNQLGFMVCGIGVGTALGLNGAATHAFAHILYKALLFMSMGAVLYRAGTVKATELGGLYKRMPWTTAFCVIGAMSISAFPLFSGFVAKSLTMSATAGNHYFIAWVILLFASAGVLEHSGIKIPYFAFFAHDHTRDIERRIGGPIREAPGNMLLAMGLTAFLCLALGMWSPLLYSLAPYPVDYHPYTIDHVTTQLLLLFFAMLAFGWLVRTGRYPAEIDSTNLNTDIVYRKGLPALAGMARRALSGAKLGFLARWERQAHRFLTAVYKAHGPQGALARTWPTGSTVLWVGVLLAGSLALFYL